MRSGTWRGVSLAVVLTATLATGRSARANDPFHHTIPREVDAIDIHTGGPYLAPPIPYGHYAKGGFLGGAVGKLHGLGLGGLHGLGQCGHCGGKGCGLCGGSGLFGGHGSGHGCGDPGCDGGSGHLKRFKNCGLCKGKGCGVCTSTILASSQAISAPVAASPQGSAPCGVKGCGLGRGHKHGGDPGWGGGHGNGCNACGGKGCGLCLGGHGGLGAVKGKLFGLLHPHAGKVEYFVGPGGPVPITPGYVPYVISTRSPRDFLSFPPYTP
jgi:hypothetical protein